MNNDVAIFYSLFVSVFSFLFSMLWTFVSVSDIGLGFGARFRTNVMCCEGEVGLCCKVPKGLRLFSHLFRTRPADNSQWGMGRTCSLVVRHGAVAGAGSVLRARPVPCLLAVLLRIWAELALARARRYSWHSFDERRCGHTLLSIFFGFSFFLCVVDFRFGFGFGHWTWFRTSVSD